MLDKIMADIRNLFQELDEVEKEMELDSISDERYDFLREKELIIIKHIKKSIQKLLQEINNLQQFADDELYNILKNMEEFIRMYGEESDELCHNLIEYQEEFILDNQLVLNQLYQTIYTRCGFDDLE